jgi:hypothetical protein
MKCNKCHVLLAKYDCVVVDRDILRNKNEVLSEMLKISVDALQLHADEGWVWAMAAIEKMDKVGKNE